MVSQNIPRHGIPPEDIPQWPTLFSWPTAFGPFHQMNQIMLDSITKTNPWSTLWDLRGANVDIDEDDRHIRITTSIPGRDATLEDAELSLKDDMLIIDIPKKTARKKHKH